MKVSSWVIVAMMLGIGVGCAITPTPTPSPVPSPIPSPMMEVSKPTGEMSTQIANRNVPACPGAIDVEKPIEFPWTNIESVRQSTPSINWTYYRCNDSASTVQAFYRRWMPEQYRWIHTYSEEHTNGTLDVYFYSTGSTTSVPSRWLYLWFLPDELGKPSSYLVVTWWEAAKSC